MNISNSVFNGMAKNENEPPIPLAKDYVVSIHSTHSDDVHRKEQGNGVIVGDLLITAGHVVKNCKNTSFVFDANGNRIELNSLEKLYESTGTNNKEYDLAIYRVPGVFSPYVLSPQKPIEGKVLTSESIDNNILKSKSCNAHVKKDRVASDYYFRIDTELYLKPGCSGSPLFDGNIVYGIIVTGNNDGCDNKKNPKEPLNLCYALSSADILKVIDKLNYKSIQ